MLKKMIKALSVTLIFMCITGSASAEKITMYRKDSSGVKGTWVKVEGYTGWHDGYEIETDYAYTEDGMKIVSKETAEYWLSSPQEISIYEYTEDERYARIFGYKTIEEFPENEKITLYAGDNTMIVPSFMADKYMGLNWCKNTVTLYSMDGRKLNVSENSKDEYLSLGWYEQPSTMLYTLDGREEAFPNDEVEAQCQVGWYKEKPVLLYTLDGRQQYFMADEAEAQCQVGWYKEKPVTLYTLDGRSQMFPAEKAAEQQTVGWYYWSEIEKRNQLAELARSFYIGQRVWCQKSYYALGYVCDIDMSDGKVSVIWDTYKDLDWYTIYNQYSILSAESLTGITLGEVYTYNADEIKPYK